MKYLIPAVALTFAIGFAALADEHPGNSGNAKAMVKNINTFGGNVAPAVSGKNAFGTGDSGWGNAGSRATGAGLLGGGYAEGGQVSKSGKP